MTTISIEIDKNPSIYWDSQLYILVLDAWMESTEAWEDL